MATERYTYRSHQTANGIAVNIGDSVRVTAPAIPHLNPARPHAISYPVGVQHQNGLQHAEFKFSPHRSLDKAAIGRFIFELTHRRPCGQSNHSLRTISGDLSNKLREEPRLFGHVTDLETGLIGSNITGFIGIPGDFQAYKLRIRSRFRGPIHITGAVDSGHDVSQAAISYNLALRLWGGVASLLRLEDGDTTNPLSLEVSTPVSGDEIRLLALVEQAIDTLRMQGASVPTVDSSVGYGAVFFAGIPDEDILTALGAVVADCRDMYGDTGIMPSIAASDIASRLTGETMPLSSFSAN